MCRANTGESVQESELFVADSASAEEVSSTVPLAGSTVWFMAISVGAIVANIYYAQPLLADMARTFRLTVTEAGAVAMLSQAGSALGMLLFVPLGDTRERRSLITMLLIGAAASLLLVATALNAIWLIAATVAVGAASAAVHVFLPFAAHLAPPERRGRVVGTVLSGLLVGVLLARTFSGFLGARFGWRAVYAIAAAMMFTLVVLVQFFLPRSEPSIRLSYPDLLRSIAHLFWEYPELRESALLGSIFFCAFSAFWTTLIFLLETPPYHYGSQVAGLFGLVGMAGALGAPLVGRLADRFGARPAIGLAMGLVFASYLVLGSLGRSMAGLIFGVVLLDFAVQSGHVSNQTRIYGLAPEARSRLNTVYMVCYFSGGALGSVLGAWSWRIAGWAGVCSFGLAVSLLGLTVFAASALRTRRQRRAASLVSS
ncbi:MAG TPA: MFS transporter [Acidobacteriaceae bacterium]|nr:MFS transporter [Acidobacteriaceae bacterium]